MSINEPWPPVAISHSDGRTPRIAPPIAPVSRGSLRLMLPVLFPDVVTGMIRRGGGWLIWWLRNSRRAHCGTPG
jgi:hypothetical protein